MVKKRQLETLRRQLEKKRTVLSRIPRATKFLVAEPSHDRLDDARSGVDLDLAVSVINKDWEIKSAVELALERMDTGEYGICASCEDPISTSRLIAVPWATRCVACQSFYESGGWAELRDVA